MGLNKTVKNRGELSTDAVKITRIIRDYYEQMHETNYVT